MAKTESGGVERVVRRRDVGSGWVTRRIAGKTLIVPVSNQVENLDAIYTLNDVAARIWDLLETPMSEAAITEVLADEYDVSADRVAADVTEFLDLLETRGVLELVSSGI